MAVPENVLRVSTTLRLGERVLVRCDDGLLSTEYVLFDPTDIVLRATDPVTVRETGYITTSRDALARLAAAGVTPKLAEEAAGAIPTGVAASFIRSVALAPVAAELGACELFDGAVYLAAHDAYLGAWLDLPALVGELRAEGASAALQALYLAAALQEVPSGTPVHMSTSSKVRDRRPGERTHRRVGLESPGNIVAALRSLRRSSRPALFDVERDRRLRDALLGRVRERASAEAGPALRAHVAQLESALAAAETRSTGPLADPELWAIERKLAAGDATGVRERLAELERSRGSSAAVRYLRARAALVAGDEPPGQVAEVLSSIANEGRGFHEAELVAARAWLAAGEEAYARHFARRLVEDDTARDSERLVALEILDTTSASAPSQAPPPVVPVRPQPGPAPVAAQRVIAVASPTPTPVPAQAEVAEPSDPLPEVVPARAAPHGQTSPGGADIPRGASLPAVETVPPPPQAVPARRNERGGLVQARYDPELVESLALPPGATENVLAVGEWPITPIQVRTAMTRLARSLARDYRLWYGTTLRCNVLAVDAVQRHLVQRYSGAQLNDPRVLSELQRHGALVSEIFARALGAEWVDIAPSEPGYWAMFVPPATRCWPIGRVYRFVALGHSQRDLVSYYLEVEARHRA
jgi:hypothetical protein